MAGNDQDMGGSDRIDIGEGQGPIGSRAPLRRDLSVGYPTEQAGNWGQSSLREHLSEGASIGSNQSGQQLQIALTNGHVAGTPPAHLDRHQEAVEDVRRSRDRPR